MRLTKSQLIALAKETIDKQVLAVQQLKAQINESFAQAIELIVSANGRSIISGMGKSGHIGTKIAATLASTGTPAFFVHPAEAFHGDLGMITPDDVIILISYSGETDEVNKLIPSLKAFGVKIISIVGVRDSTLATHSDVVLTITVTSEACPNNLAPTSSTMATLAIGDALAVALIEERQFQATDFARYHPGGTLGKRLLTRVADVMHKDNLPKVEKGTSMIETIETMNSGRLGTAVVLENDKVVGIITDGDLRRAIAKGMGFLNQNCEDIMTPSPVSVTPNEKFATAESMMLDRKINTVVVVNETLHLVGILQIYDF